MGAMRIFACLALLVPGIVADPRLVARSAGTTSSSSSFNHSCPTTISGSASWVSVSSTITACNVSLSTSAGHLVLVPITTTTTSTSLSSSSSSTSTTLASTTSSTSSSSSRSSTSSTSSSSSTHSTTSTSSTSSTHTSTTSTSRTSSTSSSSAVSSSTSTTSSRSTSSSSSSSTTSSRASSTSPTSSTTHSSTSTGPSRSSSSSATTSTSRTSSSSSTSSRFSSSTTSSSPSSSSSSSTAHVANLVASRTSATSSSTTRTTTTSTTRATTSSTSSSSVSSSRSTSSSSSSRSSSIRTSSSLSISSITSAATVDTTQPTLVPVVPPHIDPASNSSLVPQQNGQLFFTQNAAMSSSNTGVAARISMNYLTWGVILDHAFMTYSSVSCTAKTMTIAFPDCYYSFIKPIWTAEHYLLIITSEKACSAWSDGSHHSYFETSQLSWNDRAKTVTLTGRHATLEEVLHDLHVEFGVYTSVPAHRTTSTRRISTRRPSTLTTSTTSRTTSRSSSSDRTATTTSSSGLPTRTSGTTATSSSSSTGTVGSLAASNTGTLSGSGTGTLTGSGSGTSTGTLTGTGTSTGSGTGSGTGTATGSGSGSGTGTGSGTATGTGANSGSASSSGASTSASGSGSNTSGGSQTTSGATTGTSGAASSSSTSGNSTASVTGSTLSNSTVPSNSTASSNSTSLAACGTLASPMISGLPAAACGPNFDQQLDDALGYLSFDDDSFEDTWAAIAPGASLDDFDDDDDDDTTGLSRRGLFHGKFTFLKAIKSIATSVKASVQKAVSAVKNIGNTIKSVAKAIAKAVVSIAKFVVEVLEGDPHFTLSLPTSYHLGARDSSPWGLAKLLHLWKKPAGQANSKADNAAVAQKKKHEKELLPDNLDDVIHAALYCVGCGFNGTFAVTGAAGYSLTGLHNLSLDAVGNLDMGLGLGLDALAIKKVELAKKTLFEYGLPGFSIPGIIIIGPALTVQAGIDFELKAVGQALAKATLSYRQAKAHMDLLNPANSYHTNWKPTLTSNFTIHGELSAGVVFDLPVGLSFGVSIAKGKWKKQVALVDSTSLEVTAKIEVDASVSGSANSSSGANDAQAGVSFNNGSCAGIEWDVSIHNQLNFDVLKIRNYKIFEVKLPVADGCVGLEVDTSAGTGVNNPGSSPSSSASPTASPVCTPAANSVVNGDFESGALTPWVIDASDFGSSYQVSSPGNGGNYGFTTNESPDDSYNNPYSRVVFHQMITLCAGSTYTFSMDHIWNYWSGDVYSYGTLYFPDGTTQGVFGARSTDNVGQWTHSTSSFTVGSAAGGVVKLEILTVACAYEGETIQFDNIAITPGALPSKRGLDLVSEEHYNAGVAKMREAKLRHRRQYDFDEGALDDSQNTGVALDQTLDGSDEDTDDAVPDDLDTLNDDGTLANPPDDSDLDGFIDDSETAISEAEDDSFDFPDLVALGVMPAGFNDDNATVDDSGFPATPAAAGGVSYMNLVSQDATFQLTAGDDGNLYLGDVDQSSPAGLFAGIDGIYIGDFSSRFFHMYSTEMSVLNVSRLRLHDETDFPSTGQIVSLTGVSADTTNMYIVVDTLGNPYYLAACNFAGSPTKVFIVQDPDAGLDVLKSSVASYTVTGGVTNDCFLVGLNAPVTSVSV